jgi:GST-like protein
MSTRLHAAASDITHNRDPDKAKEQIKKHLESLDKEMAGRKYIVGEYSLADVSYIPFYTRRERYGVVIDNTHPNLKRWGEELIARPQVAKTL